MFNASNLILRQQVIFPPSSKKEDFKELIEKVQHIWELKMLSI